MPDISMCLDDSCPVRESCYRYRAVPNPRWQSMLTGRPWDNANMECDYRMPLMHGDRTRPLAECDEVAKRWWERAHSKSRAKRLATMEGLRDK